MYHTELKKNGYLNATANYNIPLLRKENMPLCYLTLFITHRIHIMLVQEKYSPSSMHFFQEQATITRLNDAAVNAATFLVRNIPSMTTDYEKAISAYALVRNNVNHADFLLNSLESSGNKTSDSKYILRR